MSKSSDVVETLLSLDEGERVRIEASRYEWSTPFVVEDINRVEWETIDGSFVSAQCRLESESPYGGAREWDIVEGGDPPAIRDQYGDLKTIERVDEDEVARPSAPGVKSEDGQRVRQYLIDQAEEADDTVYVKTHEVGDTLGLSTKGVGRYINTLRKHDGRLDIEDWGYSSSTTWAIKPLGGDEESKVESGSATTEDDAGDPTADWLARPVQEIVATEDIEHTLGAILDAVEVGDNIGQVAYELDKEDPPRKEVASVLWELGLRQKNGQLHDEETLQERIEALREVRP